MYSKAAENDTKLRIIAAAEKDSDWKAAARPKKKKTLPLHMDGFVERMKLPRNAGDTKNQN